MIGFLFVAAVVLVVALLAFRMIPAYIEYYTIQKALESARWPIPTICRRPPSAAPWIASFPPTTPMPLRRRMSQ